MKSVHAGMMAVAVLGLASGADAQARRRSSVVPGELRLGGGRRTVEAVRFLLVRNTARVHACYDAALQANPAIAGTLVVRMVIEVDGVVSSVSVGDRTIPEPTMVSCVLQSFRALQFGPSMGSSTTAIYTMRFLPGVTR